MKKKKIIQVMAAILLTSTISLGGISELVKAETTVNSISGVKNVTSSARDTLAEIGEKELSNEECNLISSKDCQYLEEKSADIPYEKFTIKTNEKISDSDAVKVNWTGHGEAGNKISMYAWNLKNSSWDKLCEKNVQDSKDFTLESQIIKGNYNDNNNIYVKVQSESQDDDSFSFAWMTDTQFYCQTYPEVFNTEINYILSNKNKENIKYVIHTGDIVNNMEQGYQWVNADNSLKIFDNASMAYGVLAGNHDVFYDNKVDYSVYKKHFGENRYKNNSWYGGSYDDNKGHYDLLSQDGNDFIVLYMGWDIGQNEYNWMNKILAKYKDRKAILCFHKYLTPEGERDDVGEGIYKNVVLKNTNVNIVLCGHYSGASNKINEIDDDKDGTPDRTVYEILSDYQDGANGGDGYLRFMKFDENAGAMSIKTYSPKLDDYKFYDNKDSEKNSLGYKDEFTIPMDLNKSIKVLATDCFASEENKTQAAVNNENKEQSYTDTKESTQEVKDENETEYKGGNNTAETGDLYLEMIVIILTISTTVIISEIKIRKLKKLQ